MNLAQYDDLCVRVMLIDGEYAEGACMYNSDEYNFHEYGRDEESLQIASFQFYMSDIAKVEIITEENPYRRPYDMIQELSMEDGPDYFQDLLESEDERNVKRALAYLEDHMTRPEFPYRKEMRELLKTLIRYTEDTEVRTRAEKLLAETEEQ